LDVNYALPDDLISDGMTAFGRRPEKENDMP
jgi:hypothetical protein